MSKDTTRNPLQKINGNVPPSKLKPKEVSKDLSTRYSFMQPKENANANTSTNTLTNTTTKPRSNSTSKIDQNATFTSSRIRTNSNKQVVKPTTSSRTLSTSTTSTRTSRSTNISSSSSRQNEVMKLDELAKIVFALQEEIKKDKLLNIEKQQQLELKEQKLEILSVDKEKIESESKQELEAASEKIKQFMRKIEEIKSSHQEEIEDLNDRNNKLEDKIENLQVKLEFTESQLSSTKKELTTTRSELNNTKNDLEEITNQLENKTNECKEKKNHIEQLENEREQMKKIISKLEAKEREHEMIRRKLHNAIQELKGNIRVFCRVRPLLGEEAGQQKIEDYYEFPETNENRDLKVYASKSKSFDGKDKQQKLDFTFDKVFGPESTQAQVFDELSQLVQSSLDGYNTCIFTYGQTGSGKTYTMEGSPDGGKKNRGMIQRSIEQIFISAEKLREIGWEYTFHAYFLEIYNETIRDLLSSKSANKETKYKINHTETETEVTNVKTVKVETPEQIHNLIEKANKNRSVGKTLMNDVSSRSHSVFTLKIQGHNKITSAKTKAVLNLIDLAGSEKVTTTERLNETKNINKSLACIGDVISSLANGEKHIPYRNSKLTYLLQNSLGGNSKTLMFVNISPRVQDLNESLTSLRFAVKVNACEIGTAKKGGKIDLNNDK